MRDNLSHCVGRVFELKDGQQFRLVGIVGNYAEITQPPLRAVKRVPRGWLSEQMKDAKEIPPSTTSWWSHNREDKT